MSEIVLAVDGNNIAMRDDEKICTTCGVEKSIKDFHKHNTRADGRQSECKKCQTIRARAWRHANPASAKAHSDRHKEKLRASGEMAVKTRAYNLKAAYGITVEQFDEMLQSQGGVCAICKGPPVMSNGSDRFHVDHDHKTGQVRGLLCGHCNTGLGLYRDSAVLLWRAIMYLVRSRGV